jgi:cytochrome c peroxidase
MLLPVLAAASPVEEGDELWKLATTYFEPLPPVADNPSNPVTEAKVGLGRLLFFDKRLSVNEKVSCNSCHSLAAFGVDALPVSPGDAGQLGDRNSPTVLNAALHGSQFWDGRAADVEDQAGMPIMNPVEMGIPSEQFLVDRLSTVPDYVERFRAAFPGDDPALSYTNVRRALAAFERTLLTPSPFDAYLRGDRNALDGDQQAGLKMFLDLGCASCHNGINVGAASFRKFGLNDPYWIHTRSAKVDDGRVKVTGDEEDRFVFRVASLRNVAATAPYFHDGSVAELDEALKIMTRLQVGVELEPVQLRQLQAFLESLTGRLDPEVAAEIEKIHPD